ncbi:S-methyl-5'-thioadenosine phosphorylase [Williamsia sp. CHRR-6]|uniref:S-methyl-5'-thioadenosine phosphorylase n=1 Tax=Williamsia sp. CHRR-6 TaxID=2835871 RepID=UPI001BDA9F8F|nr:S-methyl-5'-thioadenosine phosphorylase [Williamsia sp. CHRR-6]MBT0567455.1 S-methyl-5'-thioadenosine phosphorylase [Williamsia sp. CHRR-6]
MTHAQIAIIGGTGFYSFFDGPVDEVVLDTPFGPPSAPVTIGRVDTGSGDAVSVAFLPRHGRDHEYAPHTVPYRANLWALRSLAVQRVFAPCAVGSLNPDIGPGTLVVPDQLVDRTSGRPHTYFDAAAVHVSFADPYCPQLRDAARVSAPDAIAGGTMVVVEGPRFSTRAESQWFARQGWTLVNMTGHPEAVLARELQMCYAAVALVTDTDAGVAEGEGVSEAEVYAVFQQGLGRLKAVLRAAVIVSGGLGECTCAAGDHDVDALLAGTGPG